MVLRSWSSYQGSGSQIDRAPPGAWLRHAATLCSGVGRDRSAPMENAADIKLSPSEKWTLQKVAEGDFHVSELDWPALKVGSPAEIMRPQPLCRMQPQGRGPSPSQRQPSL